MSVVNMFGFEQMAVRAGVNAAQMAADGYPLLNLQSSGQSYSNVATALRNGTTRLRLWWTYAISSNGAYGRNAVIFNRSGRELFNNPVVTTKGVIGFRFYIDNQFVQYKTAFSSMTFFYVAGAPVASDVITSLPEGEHFIEVEIDYVNKVVDTYINSTKVASDSIPSLTLDAIVRFGMMGAAAGNNPTIIMGDVSDIYFTYDNQDGGVSGRLGPVRVRPLEIDEATLPSTWSVADPDAVSTFDYPVYGGSEIFKGHQLIPPKHGELPVPGVVDYTSVPAATTLVNTLVPNYSYASLSPVSVGTPIILLTKFNRPKKVSAYALQSFVAGWGFIDDWIFQGSNDGTTWTDLDTRTGLGTYFNNFSQRLGAFKLTPAKIGWYSQYRIRATKYINHGGTSSTITLFHFQVLGDLADVIENSKTDVPSRGFDAAMVQMDFPVVRTGTDGSAAEFGFKVPNYGLGDIMAVQVGLAGRRDSGSEEKLIVKTSLGDVDGVEKDIALPPHVSGIDMIEFRTQNHRGQPWSRIDLDNLKVVIKSKTGA